MDARSPLALAPLALAVALGPLACGGASPDPGVTAYLRVSALGAQFETGELTTEPREMAPTLQLSSKSTRIAPGVQNRSLSGSAGPTATSVLVGLGGDVGHWIVPVGGVPDVEPIGNWIFTASLSFSSDLPLGDHVLVGRAVAADGTVGPARTLPLKAGDPSPLGALVIELAWDAPVDLDLHVHVTPSATNADGTPVKPFDVWAKTPLALPGGSHASADLAAAGVLSEDSNGRCVIDGDDVERLAFDKSFPAGDYQVRVDTFSLCGAATAQWHVRAFRNPTGEPDVIAEAYGQTIDRDAAGDHLPLSGLFALDFTP
jgi:hypothetical protein